MSKNCFNEQYACKECNISKIASCFYKHPLTHNWLMGRCKDCVKNGRKTEHELNLSRKRDQKRYAENIERRRYIYESSSLRRKNKWYWKIHTKTIRYINKKRLRPSICSICFIEPINKKIEAHHRDYNIRNSVIFCCKICHSKLDSGKINHNNCVKVDLLHY